MSLEKLISKKTVLLLLSVLVLSVGLIGCANSTTAPAAQSQIQPQTLTPRDPSNMQSAPTPTPATEQAADVSQDESVYVSGSA